MPIDFWIGMAPLDHGEVFGVLAACRNKFVYRSRRISLVVVGMDEDHFSSEMRHFVFVVESILVYPRCDFGICRLDFRKDDVGSKSSDAVVVIDHVAEVIEWIFPDEVGA